MYTKVNQHKIGLLQTTPEKQVSVQNIGSLQQVYNFDFLLRSDLVLFGFARQKPFCALSAISKGC